MTIRVWKRMLYGLAALILGACSSKLSPIRQEAHVDLPRFMGDWYVISNIPTFIEKGAHNAIESYRLNSDGTVATTFTFHEDTPDGPLKKYEPTGFIVDKQSNAVWGMQFMWPFKGDYRIVYVDPEYIQTIIGREARDYVWIMSKKPALTDSEYSKLLAIVKKEGYDISQVQKVPQQW